MSERIFIHEGHLALTAPEYGTIILATWADATEALNAAFPRGVVVAVEHPTNGHSLMLVTPGAPPTLVEPTSHAPGARIIDNPWAVHVPELAQMPVYAHEREAAFTIARNAMTYMSDQPREVAGKLYRIDQTVEDITISDGPPLHPELACSDFDDEPQPPTQALPIASDDSLDDEWDDSLDEDDLDVDDAEIIHAHAQKMRRNPRGQLAVIIVAAVALVAAMIGFLALQGNSSPTDEPTATPSAGLSRTPIAPWTTQTVWAKSVNPDGRIGATPDGHYIATVSTANALNISEADTGKEVESIQLGGTPSIGPRGTHISGKPAIVVRVADTLTAWIEDDEALTIDLADLDSPTVLSFSGDEPLLMAEDSSRAWRVTDSGLSEPVAVSEVHRPYAMLKDGSILAGAAGPARALILDEKGNTTSDVKFEQPEEDWQPTRWLTMRPGVTVLLWQKERSDSEGILAVHDTASGEIASQVKATNVGQLQQATAISSDRSTLLGVPGYLIDSAAPEAAPVSAPGFTPSAAAGQMLFGRDKSGARAVVDQASGSMTVLSASTLVPWTVTEGGMAVVVEGSTAYAVKKGSSSPQATRTTPDTGPSGHASETPATDDDEGEEPAETEGPR